MSGIACSLIWAASWSRCRTRSRPTRRWCAACSRQVWVYPTRGANGALHFLADSNAAITKGIIALVLLTVQDRMPADVAAFDIEGALAPFDLKRQLSSNRTQGLPNMIALIRETAARFVAEG